LATGWDAYEIIAAIGAGGMGEVWKARDTRLDIEAIKRLKETQSSAYWRGGMGAVYLVSDSKLMQCVAPRQFANPWFVS
jgi:serine/threonine protein kinase